MHGTRRTELSSCMPPESVKTARAAPHQLQIGAIWLRSDQSQAAVSFARREPEFGKLCSRSRVDYEEKRDFPGQFLQQSDHPG